MPMCEEMEAKGASFLLGYFSLSVQSARMKFDMDYLKDK